MHPVFVFLIGSARRKLTCTICNRKCSSSLNLQEHRKVSSSTSALQLNLSQADTLHGSERIYSAYAVLHDPFLQWCLSVPFLQPYPSHSTVSITQSNLLILRLPLLHVLPSSFIPSLLSSLKPFWMTQSRGRFHFHELIPQVFWNWRGSVCVRFYTLASGSSFLLMDYRKGFEHSCLNSCLKHFYADKMYFIPVNVNSFSVCNFALSDTCDWVRFSKLHSFVE